MQYALLAKRTFHFTIYNAKSRKFRSTLKSNRIRGKMTHNRCAEQYGKSFQSALIQRNSWKIQDGRCCYGWCVACVTILLNRPHRSRRFIYFKTLFSCKKHQVKISKPKEFWSATWRLTFKSWSPAR